MSLNELKIEQVALDKIKPYKNNAKKHPAEQVANVAESIRTLGWRQPIVLDKNGVIIIGHGRFLAAKQLGLETAPCHYALDLTEAQAKKLRLLDNKLNESEWDLDILKLDAKGLNFSEYDLDWGGVFETINPDDFGEGFSLPSGDKSEFEQMTFTLHKQQAELIRQAISVTKNQVVKTFGNENSNGNALYEVVRQWDAQKK